MICYLVSVITTVTSKVQVTMYCMIYMDLQRVFCPYPKRSICSALFVTSKERGKTTTDLCCNVIHFR